MCFCTNPGIRQRFSHIPNNPQTTTYFEYESFLLVPFLKIIFQPYTMLAYNFVVEKVDGFFV